MNLFKFLKKSLATVTSTALLASLVVVPSTQAALNFTDAAEIPSWATEAIEELVDQGVISGNDDGSFAPNRQLNRAEVAKIVALATGVEVVSPVSQTFPDVPRGAWFYDYIETMYANGWIDGYPDGYFRPEVGINRAEVAKMSVQAFGIDQVTPRTPSFSDVRSTDWFYSYVETAVDNGLMLGYGDGTFGPSNPVTRAETAVISYNSQLVVAEPAGPADGTLEVALSNLSPRGTNVPYNATSVPYATFAMTASDDADVEISSLTMTRLGLGDNDDFKSIWVEIDGFKVGSDKSVNNDDIAQLRFNPPIVIPAGQTVLADVVASLENDPNDVGHINRFALVSNIDVQSTAANVVGAFPIEGEEMEVANYTVSELDFETLSPNGSTVNVGDQFVEIGKFRLNNVSESNKDVEIRAVTFKNDGTAELVNSLQNVVLYVSGQQISAETIMDGDYVTFRLDNGVTGGYILEDGQQRSFSIAADIVSAEKNDNIQFKIDNYEDVVAVEVGTAFGVRTTNSSGNTAETVSCNGTADPAEEAEDDCATLGLYTVDAGALNVSRDSSNPGSTEYAPGTNDVVTFVARVVVDQPMVVEGVTTRITDIDNIDPTASDDDDNGTNPDTDPKVSDFNETFENWKLYVNDSIIDSQTKVDEATSAGAAGSDTLTVVFDSSFELAGTSIIQLTVNVDSNAADNASFKTALYAEDFDNPEYISTGESVDTSNDVVGSAVGSSITVISSEMEATRTDGFSNKQIVAGVTKVTALKFVLDNNDSGDVNVTSLSLAAAATGSARELDNFTATLLVDGQQQGSTKNVDETTSGSGNGSINFNDISIVVPSSTQKEFTVAIDTNQTSADSVTPSILGIVGTSASVAVAQVDTVTIGGTVEAGDIFTTAINGTNYSFTATTTSTDDVAAGLAAAITADSAVSATAVTNVVTVTAATAGTAFTIASTTTEDDGGASDGQTAVDANTTANVAEVNATATGLYVQSNGLTAQDTVIVTTSGTEVEGTVSFVDNLNEASVAPLVTGGSVDLNEDGDSTDTDVDGVALVTIASSSVNSSSTLALEHTFTLSVTNVEADNRDNGNSVTTKNIDNGDVELGTGTGEAVLGGAEIELIASGTLVVEASDAGLESEVIVAGSADNEVFKIKLEASDDDIEVTDLYLIQDANDGAGGDPDGNPDTDNEVEDRGSFALYDEEGNELDTANMTAGELSFNLGSKSVLVQRDGTEYLTVRFNANDITQASETNKQLYLRVNSNPDETNAVNGVEAQTAATSANLGSDFVLLEDQDESLNYVVLDSSITIAHGSDQDLLQSTSTSNDPLYRFTVSADANGEAGLHRITININTTGATLDADQDFNLFRENGSDDILLATAVVSDPAGGAAPTGSVTSVQLQFSIENSSGEPTTDDIGAGETKEYYVAGVAAVTSTDSQSINYSILEDGDYAAADTAANLNAGSSNIIWSDGSARGTEENDFVNGYLITVPQSSLSIR